jgi:ParB-like chromosome segregation protein Spo0J
MTNPRDNLTNVLTPAPAKPEATSTAKPEAASKPDHSSLAFHPLADIFPMMKEDSEAFKALADDIDERGQDQPIWLYEGKILDGRNRYTAMKLRGLLSKLKVKDYTGDDPIGFVLAANLHRRHLNESQRAMVAAKLATMKVGENQHTSNGSMSIARAAKALNVSHGLVESAKTVLKSGNEELINNVTQGKKKVSAAVKAINKANAGIGTGKPSKPKPSPTKTDTSSSEDEDEEDVDEEDQDEEQATMAASDQVDDVEDLLIIALKTLAAHSKEKALAAVEHLLGRLEDADLLEKKAKRKAA